MQVYHMLSKDLEDSLCDIGDAKIIGIKYTDWRDLYRPNTLQEKISFAIYLPQGYKDFYWQSLPQRIFMPNTIIVLSYNYWPRYPMDIMTIPDGRYRAVYYPVGREIYMFPGEYTGPADNILYPAGFGNSKNGSLCCPFDIIVETAPEFKDLKKQHKKLNNAMQDQSIKKLIKVLKTDFYQNFLTNLLSKFISSNFNNDYSPRPGWPMQNLHVPGVDNYSIHSHADVSHESIDMILEHYTTLTEEEVLDISDLGINKCSLNQIYSVPTKVETNV